MKINNINYKLFIIIFSFIILTIVVTINVLNYLKKQEIIIFNENITLYNIKETGGLTTNPVTINTVLGNIYIKANAKINFSYPPYIGSDSHEFSKRYYRNIYNSDFEHDLLLLDKKIEKIYNLWIMEGHMFMDITHNIELDGNHYYITYLSIFHEYNEILLSGNTGTNYYIIIITTEGKIIDIKFNNSS